MIDAQRAAHIAQSLRPGLRIYKAFRYKNIYAFSMVPRDYDEKRGRIYTGGDVLIDMNTGKQVHQNIAHLPNFLSLAEEIQRSEYE